MIDGSLLNRIIVQVVYGAAGDKNLYLHNLILLAGRIELEPWRVMPRLTECTHFTPSERRVSGIPESLVFMLHFRKHHFQFANEVVIGIFLSLSLFTET